jgi:FKBP-type peptidyl-prolyl cis-trans isomerase 2
MSDFISLDYTGRVDGVVFDSTRKEDVPAGTKGSFAPVTIKVGLGQLLPGLDAFLVGKQPGTYEVTLQAEQAFGKKDPKHMKLVPMTAFGKEKNKIEPGMPVTFGESQGVIKSISGGRVVVDFNHPLAGKEVQYTLYVHGPVTDPQQKVGAILKAMLGVALPVEKDGEKTVISLPKGFPAEGLVKEIEKHTGVTVTVKEVELKGHDHTHEHQDGHTHAHPHDHDGHDHSHHH